MKRYIDLHLHAEDIFDSPNTPKRVCERMKALGAKGFALTQHGVLSGIEPMRTMAEQYGLKFIPGIETYYGNDSEIAKNRHLILLAADNIGYKAISTAVSNAQNKAGFSVMSDSMLKEHFAPGSMGHGHVIATSACFQGPLGAIIRQNEFVDSEIAKIKRKTKDQDQSKRILDLKEQLSSISEEIAKLKEARDKAKKLSETKFTARENRLKKLYEKNDPAYAGELEELNADKKKAEEATSTFKELKAEVTRQLKRQTILSQEKRALEDSQTRFEAFERRCKEIESQRISEDEINSALEKEAERLRQIFGENNFYIEIQSHGIEKEALVYPRLVQLSRRTGIPLVATNDVHLSDRNADERLQRQILRSLRFGTAFEAEHEGDAELYVKTDEEMEEWLLKLFDKDAVREALENTVRIFERCNVRFEHGLHYPRFPTRDGEKINDVFRREVNRGISWRFPNGMDEAHRERLERELSVIEGMNYADYHLIVKDFLEYGRVLASYPEEKIEEAPLNIEGARTLAKENGWSGGISIGPGRGSAVGSLVCYLLGITSLDPLKYGLLFERFLNPERVSMPDIDTDLSKAVRGKVIKYVQEKYGNNAVCGILTTNAIAPKGAIRMAAKYYGLKIKGDGVAFKSLGDAMAKMVMSEPGTSFESKIGEQSLYEYLRTSYMGDKDAAEILRWAKVLEGSFTSYGVHAAGIVISDNADVKEYVPLRWNEKLREWTTQCDMQYVEELGLLKMDFLGLKTLDIINGCIRAVRDHFGTDVNPLDIPLDDADVYREIFQKGRTNSVFQFESDSMKSMLKRFIPSTFEDLIILVSMFRPGPIQYIDGVIDVKHGREKAEYLTPELELILQNTYGGIVYQEQVMQIFQDLAGYTLGGADQVRRYMSKKKMDKLVHEKEAFVSGDPKRNIPGCVSRGIKKYAAEALFEQMTEFAKYAFNKSHATAYALISYWTGWLKYHYPAEFLAEAMNWAADDDDVRGLMRETKAFNVKVNAPDVNRSLENYTVKYGEIVCGLSTIKMVGDCGKKIIEERERNGQFSSIKDFMLRTQVKRNALENLIRGGAFDAFCPNRQAVINVIDQYRDLSKKYRQKEQTARGLETILSRCDSITSEDELNAIQEEIGVSLLDKMLPKEKLQAKAIAAKKTADELYELICGIVLDPDCYEDTIIRLSNEHKILGSYVTGHPLDAYEDGGPMGTEIGQITLDTTSIYGVITDLTLKKRKRDGKIMAFFSLEDKTGAIEVSVFTKLYEERKSSIEEGRVIQVHGKVVEEETGMLDDAGMPILARKFVASELKAVSPMRRVIISVSSYAVWHAVLENDFRTAYETEDGIKFAVYDETLDIIRPLRYRVSEDVLALPNAI